MTSLYELGKGLSGALDTRSLLEVVHREVIKSIPIDLFGYDAYSSARDTFERAFERAGPRWGTEMSAFSTEKIEREVMQSGRAYLGSSGDGRSIIVVPVSSKQKAIGILLIGRMHPESFTEDHLRLVQSIANLTGLALDRAILYEDTVTKSNEIEHRNKELDDFTYVVSHDLKEPLITIEGYSKIVLKEYREKVDEEGKAYLSSVVHASARMKNLIDDLLTLSRVGRVAEMMQPVAVGKVVSEIVRDFEFTLREKNARVNVPPDLPTVQYNPTQLSMIFRNLISNSIKFNARPEPMIDIAVRESPEEYTFSVSDNGIGIEKQHFDKIFVIFQRLHRSEEYQGTGAGLTIVKKIVEIHRGRIWVESELGKGTSFYFTIPR